MVAAGALEHHQQSPAASKTAEEEASKRNTDCVYFLASPLTCKKGSECEYRHSEYARVNPRDCYYWLNGNCLNPRCPFRHPPLDGLLGTQTAVPAASSFPSLHSTTPPAKYSTNNLDKQVTPCIFFQKGLCIKGDKCVFLHGPNNAVNKTPNPAVASTANEPPTLKKSSGVARNCTQEQKFPPKNAPKAVVGRPEVNKPTQNFEIALSRNDAGSERNAPPPSGIDNDVNVPPITNGNSLSRISRLQQSHALDDQSFQHNMESDEFLRESSPGFDVLVADELRDHDYYREEGQYLRTRDHEGRDLNPVTDYDVGLSIEYNSMTDMERETFHHPRGYESYDHVHGQYDWGQHKAASDRMSVGGSHQERKSFSKAENHTRVDESDLRYRLSKQRRVNGLRSVVSPDYAPEFQRSSQREMHNLSSKESSLSSRLRGRIKLHSRSPVNGGDLRPERELDRGRNWGSVSPGRPRMSHVSRLPDRLKGRVEVDFDNRGRNLMDEGDANFSGPKSLSELKGGKNAESQERQSFRKRKSLKDPRQPEGDLSFDGPMPLCEILKRKRGAEATTVASTVISSVNNNNNNSKENEESLAGSSNSNTAQSAVSTVIKEASNSKEANIVKEIECINQPSQLPSASEVEAEDGVIGEERMEDQYLEADDQRDGEYEYEPGYEGDYHYEEGVNADGDEESYADDDGDDFAKKIGVMFS